jgi:hypothetical protein
MIHVWVDKLDQLRFPERFIKRPHTLTDINDAQWTSRGETSRRPNLHPDAHQTAENGLGETMKRRQVTYSYLGGILTQESL